MSEQTDPAQAPEADAWGPRFDAESIRVSHALVLTAARIVHVGGTAQPSPAATPVIDIMVGVDRYPPTPAFIEPLETIGYSACGERGLPGRLYYTKRGPADFDLHLVQFNGRRWNDCLLLRDYLAANPDAAGAFESRKRELRAGPGGIAACAQFKVLQFPRLLEAAARWKAAAINEASRAAPG
jgi:GrpB-like predicted nucleotidyltransferase (UPF0157 family)